MQARMHCGENPNISFRQFQSRQQYPSVEVIALMLLECSNSAQLRIYGIHWGWMSSHFWVEIKFVKMFIFSLHQHNHHNLSTQMLCCMFHHFSSPELLKFLAMDWNALINFRNFSRSFLVNPFHVLVEHRCKLAGNESILIMW